MLSILELNQIKDISDKMKLDFDANMQMQRALSPYWREEQTELKIASLKLVNKEMSRLWKSFWKDIDTIVGNKSTYFNNYLIQERRRTGPWQRRSVIHVMSHYTDLYLELSTKPFKSIDLSYASATKLLTIIGILGDQGRIIDTIPDPENKSI